MITGGSLAAATMITSLMTTTGPAAAAATNQAVANQAATDQLAWGPCPPGTLTAGESRLPAAASLQCAAITVPLDYRDPHGRTISVEVSRVASPDPAARRGVLLINPGGPGDSGLGLPVDIAALAPQSLLNAYDLIGFDPRGVGASTPVTCGMTVAQESDVLSWPLVPGGVPANAVADRQIAAQCQTDSGAELPDITTANTARDMDRIRVALGEARISYLGYSYGTYLGAVYANLFPDRTDRVILDSNVDPDLVWHNVIRSFGPADEIRFPDFENWLADRSAQYNLGSTPQQVRATYFALAAKLDATPEGGITGNLFRDASRAAMYSDSLFPLLAQLWQELAAGTASLVAMPQLATAPTTAPADNEAAALLAVFCDDVSWPRSVPQYEADVARDSRLFPIAGPMAADVMPCAFWADRPRQPLVPITSAGPRDILLLDNTRDPATPYFGALGMRAALGRRAAFVTVNQGGHGVYLVAPNTCANDLATAWLVTGALPAADQYCPASPAADSQAQTQVRQRLAQTLGD
jgi:pimeloyl-ACP methyl ester carboxylesterase